MTEDQVKHDARTVAAQLRDMLARGEKRNLDFRHRIDWHAKRDREHAKLWVRTFLSEAADLLAPDFTRSLVHAYELAEELPSLSGCSA